MTIILDVKEASEAKVSEGVIAGEMTVGYEEMSTSKGSEK